MNNPDGEATPEVLNEPFHETLQLAAAVGNHEMKALTLLVMAQEHRTLNVNGLDSALRRRLEAADAQWIPSKNVAFQYCQSSFEPIGQVVKAEYLHRDKIAVGYDLTEQGKEVGVPFAGLILGWSLKHRDLSVQKLFGPTTSSSDNRAPEHRAGVLLQLLTHPSAGAGLTVVQCAGIENLDASTPQYRQRLVNTDAAVEALDKIGVIDVKRDTENDRQFEIVEVLNPADGRRRKLNGVLDSVYRYADQLVASGQRTFSAGACLDFVVKNVLSHDPAADPANIRLALSSILSGDGANKGLDDRTQRVLPGIRRLTTFNDGGHTRVTVNPEFRDAIDELIQIIVGIDYMDPATLQRGTRLAHEIMSNRANIKTLSAKAYKNSSNAQRQPQATTAGQLIKILGSKEQPLKTDDLVEAYETEFGRKISAAAVQTILKPQIETGQVQLEQKRRLDTRKRAVNYYQLPAPDGEPPVS